MANNERVQWSFQDIHYQQLASSEDNRTDFTPGKATQDAGGMNWELDYKIPTGTPAFDSITGPVTMQRERIIKLGRNIVSDDTIPDGLEDVNTINNFEDIEKTSGYDWINE